MLCLDTFIFLFSDNKKLSLCFQFFTAQPFTQYFRIYGSICSSYIALRLEMLYQIHCRVQNPEPASDKPPTCSK